MSRPVAGLACRIRVPVRQYQAVALLATGNSNVIRLMHRDVGLSLDVEAFDNFAAAEEYRDRLAGFLDLPPLVIAASPKAGRSDATDAARERRVRPGRTRRPRFLTRRHAGGEIAIRKIDGREIIARS
jgi:hypothetical protein